jgi:hypothetical protein
MRVVLEDLQKALEYLDSIETTELKNIEWIQNGNPVPISDEVFEDWRFTGLLNRDFAKEYLLPGKEE